MNMRVVFLYRGKNVREIQNAPLPNVGEEVNVTTPTGPYWGKAIERTFTYGEVVTTVYIHFE